MESNPPNINYFESEIFNSILFDSTNNDNFITIDYLNNKYLQKHENITNATSTTGSFITLGGISIKKDLYIGCNLISIH